MSEDEVTTGNNVPQVVSCSGGVSLKSMAAFVPSSEEDADGE